MIIVEKWEDYQVEEINSNNKDTTNAQQTHTNKNVKNINNIYSPFENGQDEKTLANDFDKIWSKYPRKEGKAKAFKSYKAWLKGKKVCGKNIKLTNKQIWYAVRKYAEESKEKEKTYIKMGNTFFADAILDYVEAEDE